MREVKTFNDASSYIKQLLLFLLNNSKFQSLFVLIRNVEMAIYTPYFSTRALNVHKVIITVAILITIPLRGPRFEAYL